MKTFSWWSVAGVVGLGAVLSGCGSGSSGSSTDSLRLVNATLTHPSLDLLVNSTVTLSATAADTVSAYAAPAAGGNTLQVDDTGSLTALTTTVPTLSGGLHYTLLAYESGGTVKTVVLGEDDAAPATGAAQMRFYDTALDAGKLDVYVTAPGADLTTVSPTTGFGILTAPTATALFTYSPGTYEVRVTGAGNKSDLRADISVTLTSQQIANVALTPAAGGVLLNGSTLIEQGTYAAARNTNARVRLAAAVSGGATVAATATSGTAVTTIASGVSPAFGYYVLVPANSALNISVNGQSVGAPAATLAAGTDATLLVYGAPGTAVASLIADDNRLPTDPTTVKLRLINGITGSAGALTLTANTAPVGVGIAPAAASSYVSVLGSTNAMNLSLTSSTAGAFPPNTSFILNPGSVYTVMAAGDVSVPQLLIR